MFKENVCVGGKHYFFHLTDISIVKSFILFRLHQTNNPDNTKLKRKAGYSLGDIALVKCTGKFLGILRNILRIPRNFFLGIPRNQRCEFSR